MSLAEGQGPYGIIIRRKVHPRASRAEMLSSSPIAFSRCAGGILVQISGALRRRSRRAAATYEERRDWSRCPAPVSRRSLPKIYRRSCGDRSINYSFVFRREREALAKLWPFGD